MGHFPQHPNDAVRIPMFRRATFVSSLFIFGPFCGSSSHENGFNRTVLFFGLQTFGLQTFGQQTFGQQTFGQQTFG